MVPYFKILFWHHYDIFSIHIFYIVSVIDELSSFQKSIMNPLFS